MTSPLLSPLPEYSINVLIVDDQRLVAEAVRQCLVDQKDITLHHCIDGKKAVEVASQLKPTVILQDIVMPDTDGIRLVEQYRANPATRDIPIIMLSSREEPEIKAEAFAAGGNDYVVKLPNKLELIARIRYHSKNYIRLLQRNEAYRRLEESEKALKAELNEAATYVQSLLPPPIHNSIDVTWKFIPSARLGGDTFGYHWVDKEHFALYLLDVCGHGVGAALLSVAVLNFLRNLPESLILDPKGVLKLLNAKFPMENHNNMFFSVWYGVFNTLDRTMVYSNGGHPPAVVVRQKLPIELTTPGVVIGVESKVQFSQSTFKLEPGDQLFIFSDGAFELVRDDGQMLDYHQFVEELATISPQDPLDRIVQFSYEWQGRSEFVDDYSLLRLEIK